MYTAGTGLENLIRQGILNARDPRVLTAAQDPRIIDEVKKSIQVSGPHGRMINLSEEGEIVAPPQDQEGLASIPFRDKVKRLWKSGAAGLGGLLSFLGQPDPATSSQLLPAEADIGRQELIAEEPISELETVPNDLTSLVLAEAQEERGFEDVGSDVFQENLNLLKSSISDIESSHDPEAKSDISSARGKYQWLTNKRKGQPAFVTALNRASQYYTDKELPVPHWIKQAYKHNDPTKLTDNQQDSLFMADIFERGGSDVLLKEFLSTGKKDILKELYLDVWHTDPEKSGKLSRYVDTKLYPAGKIFEEPMAVSKTGGRVARNMYNYKPRAI